MLVVFEVSVIPRTAVLKHAGTMTFLVLVRSKDGTRHDTRCASVMLMTIIFHFKDREHKTHGRYVMFVH